jgi:mannose-6-phosphate isomerase
VKTIAAQVVKRPWGTYRTIGQWSDKITVKVLTVNPRSRLSLQKHRYRDEEWLCLSGSARVRVGEKTFMMGVGDRTSILRNQLHRISSETGAELLEVSFGKFDEEDIVRLEDDYGRATRGAPSSKRRQIPR